MKSRHCALSWRISNCASKPSSLRLSVQRRNVDRSMPRMGRAGSLMCTEAPISEPLHISGKPRAEEQQEEDKGKQQADAERRGNRTRKRSWWSSRTPTQRHLPTAGASDVRVNCGKAGATVFPRFRADRPHAENAAGILGRGDSSDPDEELLRSFCPSVFAGGASLI